MQSPDQALSESGIMFDHMRVVPFLENMVQARALGSAFELGFVDYLNHRCECVFSEIKEQLECDEAGFAADDWGTIPDRLLRIIGLDSQYN